MKPRTVPDINECEVCDPVRRKRRQKDRYKIEWKYDGDIPFLSRDWTLWKRYPTLKRAEQALAQKLKTERRSFKYRIRPLETT